MVYYIPRMANNKVPKAKAARVTTDPRREAFERLFERRIEAIKEDARLLMNLSNPYNYLYDVADVEKLRSELNAILRATVDSFENRIPNQKNLATKRDKQR